MPVWKQFHKKISQENKNKIRTSQMKFYYYYQNNFRNKSNTYTYSNYNQAVTPVVLSWVYCFPVPGSVRISSCGARSGLFDLGVFFDF